LARKTRAMKLHRQNDQINFATVTPSQLTLARLAQFVWAALMALLRHAHLWSLPNTGWQKKTRRNTVLRGASRNVLGVQPYTKYWIFIIVRELEFFSLNSLKRFFTENKFRIFSQFFLLTNSEKINKRKSKRKPENTVVYRGEIQRFFS
jgi:hypothetical protein